MDIANQVSLVFKKAPSKFYNTPRLDVFKLSDTLHVVNVMIRLGLCLTLINTTVGLILL